VYQPLRDARQQVQGILAFVVEVTERVLTRQQNDALQARLLATAQMQARDRETFYQVFAETPAAICIQRGPEHRYEYANQAYQDFFPGRELLGKTVAEALPETVDSGVVALLDHVYHTGETYYGYELPLLIAQPEGPPRQMYVTFIYQAYREQGEIVGISTFAYDVAEQVVARREREAQQLLLTTVFEQAPVGIFVMTGPAHVLEVVNEQAAALLGRPRAQLLGRPYFEAMPELANQRFPGLLRQVWESGQAAYFTDVPGQLAYHPPGQPGYFNFVYQPLRDAHGQLSSIACVAVEVTEQVLARRQVQALNEELTATNDELSELNKQLTRTNVDLDTFVYTASHDLKAPITNIEGILHALRDTLPPAVLTEAVTSQLLRLL
jgi:PAS domain S-box-containing protein